MTSLGPGDATEAAAGPEPETAVRAVDARTALASANSERLIRTVTPIILERDAENAHRLRRRHAFVTRCAQAGVKLTPGEIPVKHPT